MMKTTCKHMDAWSRAYLLDTLSGRRKRRAAAHLEACPRCREMLEAARLRLARLDTVEPIEAPAGLAQRTLARITAAEALPATTQPFWGKQRLVAYAVTMLLMTGAVLLLLSSFDAGIRRTPRYTIANNLKRIALIYRMYTHESPGERFPPMAQYDGAWVPDLRVLYPEYITSIETLVDPESPEYVREEMEAALEQSPPDYERAMRLMAQHYVYHGWAVQDKSDIEEIKRFRVARGMHDSDIITDAAHIYRLRAGVERFLITDINNPAASAMAQSTLPIMIARPRPHKPDEGLIAGWRRRIGAHILRRPQQYYVPVLYMDGHVDFLPVEQAPPNVEAMIELFPEPDAP